MLGASHSCTDFLKGRLALTSHLELLSKRFCPPLPGGLVARIGHFHRRGPGSIPGQRKLSLFQRLQSHKSLSSCPDWTCILLKGAVQNISAQSF